MPTKKNNIVQAGCSSVQICGQSKKFLKISRKICDNYNYNYNYEFYNLMIFCFSFLLHTIMTIKNMTFIKNQIEQSHFSCVDYFLID